MSCQHVFHACKKIVFVSAMAVDVTRSYAGYERHQKKEEEEKEPCETASRIKVLLPVRTMKDPKCQLYPVGRFAIRVKSAPSRTPMPVFAIRG